MKALFITLLLIVSFVAIYFLGVERGSQSKQANETASATILLERIRDILEIGTVEAQFSELYTHKEYQWLDISPFRKSVIMRVTAKVTAGVRIDTGQLKLDEATRTLTLKLNPQPVLLHIDHKLDYFDMQQGTFNSFSAEDLTRLQDKAKTLIESKAAEIHLLDRAALRRDEMIRTLERILGMVGYKLVLQEEKQSPLLK